MKYTNEPQSFFSYEVIGEIGLNILEYDERGDTLTTEGPFDAIFYETFLCKMPSGVPRIIPGKHAFILKLVSMQSNRIVRSVTVLVKEVVKYEIDDGYNTCRIQFKYTIIPTMNTTDPRTYTVINPVVSHIFSSGDFIGLTIEGDMDAVVEMSNTQLRCFRHGNKLYYSTYAVICNIALEDSPTIDSVRYPAIHVVIASTLKVPSKEDLQEFKRIFTHYIRSIYQLGGFVLP